MKGIGRAPSLLAVEVVVVAVVEVEGLDAPGQPDVELQAGLVTGAAKTGGSHLLY